MRIYFFSGTGNSYYAAKRLLELSGGGALLPMASFPDGERIMIEDDAVGFAFPAYSHSVPRIVRRFASRLKAKPGAFAFGLVTHNGGPGLALRGLERALGRSGVALGAGFELLMPGNSVIVKDFTNPPAERSDRLERAEAEIAAIAEAVRGKRPNAIPRKEPARKRLEAGLTTLGRSLYRLPRHFRADASCSRCGACAKICPRGNIRVGDSISWGADCEECLACFHWCPKGAIQVGSYTRASLRYHHPEVGYSELLPDRGRPL